MLKSVERWLYAALSAKKALQVQYLKMLHTWPNLDNPRTFNEHVQALKLAPRNSLLPILADKVKVKDWVAQRLGQDVVIPTSWTGKVLPPQAPVEAPFVVKANHSSGWNHFVRSNDHAEWLLLREKSRDWLASDWHPHLHEWWYNDIDRYLLIEPIIGDNLNDYKFFCFNGRVEFIQVDEGRFTNHQRSFFDRDWTLQDFKFSYPLIDDVVPRPKHLARMIELAEELAKDFAFVRIDFYDLDAGPLFGEITFAPEAGFGKFHPRSTDVALGRLWSDAARDMRARA